MPCTESLEQRQLLTTFYVDTNNPVASDNNAGTSINKPLKTITQALNLVSNNTTGKADTIFIRGGVYHEEPNVWTTDGGPSASSRTVVSAYFNAVTGAYEPVYIDAADPTTGTWIEDGSSNIWYLNNFTTETAGVWVDWSPTNDEPSLQQISGYNGETSAYRKIVGSGVSDMYPGTYFGDATDNRLYVWLSDGSNPNSHTIEYANRSRAIYEPGTPITGGYSYASHLDFVALNLRHANVYNTVGQDPGVGIYTENDQRMIDCNVQWNTEDGVHLLGTSELINCVSSNNGGNGVAAKGNGFLISGGQYDYNFWRQYNDGSNAGIKVITNDPTIYGNIENIEAAWNYGHGIWYDTCFENSLVSDITGNYVHDNQGAGIDLEASRNFLVANNVIVSNQADGIALNAVENAEIYNNTIIGNYGIAAIELDGGTRSQGTQYPGTVGMLNNQIENNIIANNFTAYDLDLPALAEPSAEVNDNTSDYNLFYRRGGPLHFATGGTYLGSWGSTPSLLAEWQADSGQDAHSIVADPLFLAGGSGAQACLLGSDSPAIGAGAELLVVATDYAGNARPPISTYDIGAFEHVSGGVGTAGPIIITTNPAVWVDDQLPDNAAMTTPDQYDNQLENRFWLWNSITAYSGAASLDSTVAAGAHRQYFAGADPRSVGSSDTLFAYVWIDPANLPSEIMLEWQDAGGSWSHQAYWGQNLIAGGVDGSIAGQYIGPLPAAGEWVELSVPASVVGLAGQQIAGFSFDLYNGRALLDEIGNQSSSTLSGTVFQDNNGNGILDAGEPGLAGRTVYLDLNNDETDDPGDPTTVTDSAGAFAFYNISSGTYSVAQIIPAGFVASAFGGSEYEVTITGGTPVTQNFGEFPTNFTAMANGDNFAVALSPDQSTVEIWEGVPESVPPTFSIAQSQLTQLTFSAGPYKSSLTVDYTNGTPLWSDAISFNGGIQASGLAVIGMPNAGNAFIVNSNTISVNGVNLDFTNIGSLSITGGNLSDALTLEAEPAPVTFAGGGGNDVLNVEAGNYTFNGDPQPASSELTADVGSGASVTFAANPQSAGLYLYHLAGLDLAPGAIATMAISSSSANRSVLLLDSLTFDESPGLPQGELDEGKNDIIVYGGDMAAANAALQEGYNSGSWSGPGGIVSTAAASDPMHLTAIGISTGITGQFDGQPVSSSDLILKYTYVGDATLDGVVDGSDYSRIDNGCLTKATGWCSGDFNYDGIIDGSDYTLLDDAFNTQGGSLAAQIARPAAARDPIAAAPTDSQITTVDADYGESINRSAGSLAAILHSRAFIWTDLACSDSATQQ